MDSYNTLPKIKKYWPDPGPAIFSLFTVFTFLILMK